MLKTLEEPPESLTFVLATTDPQQVPPTVLSRCLQFNLRPMAPQTVQQHLAHVLADEGIAAEAGGLRLLARAARGSSHVARNSRVPGGPLSASCARFPGASTVRSNRRNGQHRRSATITAVAAAIASSVGSSSMR